MLFWNEHTYLYSPNYGTLLRCRTLLPVSPALALFNKRHLVRGRETIGFNKKINVEVSPGRESAPHPISRYYTVILIIFPIDLDSVWRLVGV